MGKPKKTLFTAILTLHKTAQLCQLAERSHVLLRTLQSADLDLELPPKGQHTGVKRTNSGARLSHSNPVSVDH